MERRTAHGRRWLALAGLLLGGTGVAHALALGDISARSALGQPFDAVIPLTLDAGESLGDVRVRLADRSEYRRLDLPYVRALPLLKVRVARDGAGRPEVQIGSREPIDDPALELLLDTRWDGGRTLREYVVLLNPPSPTLPAVSAPVPSPAPQSAPQSAPASPAAPAAEPAIYGPVKRGEILSGIAHRFKPRGASTLQMMVAIYDANPHAFVHGDMNRLRRGTSLFLPSDAAVYAVTRHQAAVTMRAQAAARRAPAAASSASLQILTPAPLSKTNLSADLRRRLTVIRRDNAEVRAENEKLRVQLVQLEQQTKRLEAKILAMPTPAAVSTPAAAPPAAVASTPAVAPVPPPSEQVGAVPPPVVVPIGPQPWWRDPFWWVAIVAVLAVIAILTGAAVFWRRHLQPRLYRDFRAALRDDDSTPFGRFRHFR